MAPTLEAVCYHHFSFLFEPAEVAERFKDIRFLLVAGCAFRAQAQAKYLAERLFNGQHEDESPIGREPVELLTKPTSRFALFKVGPVLIGNHGMGSASMSIALHELLLMCQQAKVINCVTLIRFGTCGGIGVEAGTVCITNRALDPMLQDFVELKICMKLVRRDCVVDLKTCLDLERVANQMGGVSESLGNYKVRSGATIGCNDFYEEQARTNGAICEHSPEEKLEYLRKISEAGVINMEMESNHLAAMCHKLQVSFGVICVALNNRLAGDKVTLTGEQMSEFVERLFHLNSKFIEHKLLGAI